LQSTRAEQRVQKQTKSDQKGFAAASGAQTIGNLGRQPALVLARDERERAHFNEPERCGVCKSRLLHPITFSADGIKFNCSSEFCGQSQEAACEASADRLMRAQKKSGKCTS
jgi:hypothetical protein